jgi:hypothetical protein
MMKIYVSFGIYADDKDVTQNYSAHIFLIFGEGCDILQSEPALAGIFESKQQQKQQERSTEAVL